SRVLIRSLTVKINNIWYNVQTLCPSPINYLLFVREKVVVLFKIKEKRNSQIMYHLMLLPGMIFLLIFSFVPMFGIIMAFMDYVPAKGIFEIGRASCRERW